MKKFSFVLLGLLLLFSYSAVAQNCVTVQGVVQAQLGLEHPIGAYDYWGGFTVMFFGPNFLSGFSSGQDGTDYWRGPGMHTSQGGMIGQGKGGSYNFGFNFLRYETEYIQVTDEHGNPETIPVQKAVYKDTITTYVTNAVFPVAPGWKGTGLYQASHKIVSGTGIFQNATGTLLITGTYILGEDQDGNFYGRWNPDVSGKICGMPQ